MKQQMKLKYYGRYVDDIVVVHPDQEYLKSVITSAREYLKTHLMLQLHPRKIYLQHYTIGVVFLGAVIKPYRIYIAKRTKSNFYQAVLKFNRLVETNVPSTELLLLVENFYLKLYYLYTPNRIKQYNFNP